MNLIDKYKPKKSRLVVGQYFGVKNLKEWITNWNKNQKLKASILNGPCGIGKTLSVDLIINELNFNKIEINNTEILNKEQLKKKISLNQDNKSIDSFFKKKKDIFVFEEVDHFSDKGCIQEITNIIKNTKIPIILICNEITKELKTLSNYCNQIKFFKNKPEKLHPFISNIVLQEKIKLNCNQINDLIIEHNSDIRAIINSLNFNCKYISKDREYRNYFEITKLYFQSSTTFSERDKMFFKDYFMIPLFIQENYVQFQDIESIEKSSDIISQIDTYGNMNFELLPVMSATTNLSMSLYSHKKYNGKLGFPKYLGNFSKLNKNLNLFKPWYRLDNFSILNNILFHTLSTQGKDGIAKVIQFMKTHKITKEERDLILDISLIDFKIPTKIKTAFTKELNKI
jgi:replication factor C subunit 1